MKGLRGAPPPPCSTFPLASSSLRLRSASACICWIIFLVTSTSVPAMKLFRLFFFPSIPLLGGTESFSAPMARATSYAPAATPIQAP